MALRALHACLLLLSLAAVGAAAAAGGNVKASIVADAARLPASFDARDAFYGCADIVLDQARPGCQRRRRRAERDAEAPLASCRLRRRQAHSPRVSRMQRAQLSPCAHVPLLFLVLCCFAGAVRQLLVCAR